MKENMKKKPKEKPKYNMWQNSAYMIREAWRVHKSVLALCLILVAVTVLVNLTNLFIAPVILREVETAVPLKELLLSIAGFALLLMVLSGVKAYVSANTLFGRIKVRANLATQIHHKFTTTSYPNVEDTEVLKMVEKASRSVGGNSEATEAIWGTWTDLLTNLCGFVIYLLLLSSLDPVLMIVVILTAAVGYFANKRINEWRYRYREEEEGYWQKMGYIGSIADRYDLGKDVRIFGMRPWLEDVYRSTMCLYESFIARGERVYIWGNVIDVVLALMRNGIAYLYLISMTINNGLSASEFLLYFTAVGGFTTWVTGILSGFSTLHQQSLDLSVVREYLEFPEQFRFTEGKPLNVTSVKDCRFELRNVSFRYPGAKKDTLHHLNLTIREGEKLAVVGLNGAGKTTLVKLICGLYDPTEGEVLMNGTDIREYNRYEYYKLFSAVFQQFSLLEVSVAENVTQTHENIDWPRVKECIAKAGLTEKVESLPQKYETHLGRKVYEDGVEMSGGQIQRLMLARALYKDAPVMILDEPTAALDPIAENDIYMKYNEMTKGCTSVYISHRLASTRFCDRIIFLADGNITEEGTHELLMKQGGKYAELFEVQSKYYKKGDMSDGE